MESRAELSAMALSLEAMAYEILLNVAKFMGEPTLEEMPAEIWQNIAIFLDYKSAKAFSLTCISVNTALDLNFFKKMPDLLDNKIFIDKIITNATQAAEKGKHLLFPGKELAPESTLEKIANTCEEVANFTLMFLDSLAQSAAQMHVAQLTPIIYEESHSVRREVQKNLQYFVLYDRDYHYISCLKIILNLNLSKEMKLIAIHTAILNSPSLLALFEENFSGMHLPFKNIVRYFNQINDRLELIEKLQTRIDEMYEYYKKTNYQSDPVSDQKWLDIFKELEQLPKPSNNMQP